MIKHATTILILLIAFTILGISLNVQQHTNQSDAEPTHEERGGVVEEEKGNRGVKEGSQKTNDTPSNELLWESGNNESIQESEITNYIKEIWGDNADFGINLAMCESSLNPNAVSPSGKYVGLYQFDKPTFDSNCSGVRESWQNQVVCAYELIQKGQYSRWPNCP